MWWDLNKTTNCTPSSWTIQCLQKCENFGWTVQELLSRRIQNKNRQGLVAKFVILKGLQTNFNKKFTPACLVEQQFMAFSISKKFNYKLKVWENRNRKGDNFPYSYRVDKRNEIPALHFTFHADWKHQINFQQSREKAFLFVNIYRNLFLHSEWSPCGFTFCKST